MKGSGPGNRYYRICIFLNEEEKERLFLAMYKDKATPAQLFRRALTSYIDKVLSGDTAIEVEDKEAIIL